MNRAARSIEKPLDANKSNITGTINVLEASRRAKVKKFVFSSSSSVYAGQRDKLLTEDMPLSPPHPYGVGKLAGEHYARIYHDIYGLKTVTLRFFSVYGPRQLGTIDKAGVVAKFIHNAMNDLPLELYGDGGQKRNFSYVKDVVNFVILASENDDAVGQVFNVAAEKEVSVKELAVIVKKITGKDSSMVYRPLPAGDPSRNPADITKAKKVFKYAPQYDFPTGIEETFHWYIAEYKPELMKKPKLRTKSGVKPKSSLKSNAKSHIKSHIRTGTKSSKQRRKANNTHKKSLKYHDHRLKYSTGFKASI
jgi:nucleoside-diphosphate-sugar epimerase